jgi:hypothetical protein
MQLSITTLWGWPRVFPSAFRRLQRFGHLQSPFRPIVTGEEDKSVVQLARLLQMINHASDLFVHHRDHRRVDLVINFYGRDQTRKGHTSIFRALMARASSFISSQF